MDAYMISRAQWQDLINTPDEVGNVEIEGPTFSYYDHPLEWRITVKAGNRKEEFEYKNSGIDQAQKRAMDYLVNNKAIELVE